MGISSTFSMGLKALQCVSESFRRLNGASQGFRGVQRPLGELDGIYTQEF